MKHYTSYIQDFMTRYRFPDAAVSLFTAVELRLDTEAEDGERFDRHLTAYMIDGTESLGDALSGMTTLAELMDLSPYTTQFVFVMNCTEILQKQYAAAGIDEAVFWKGCDDLRCKLLECIECEGVPGTFVAGWNDGFLKMRRFAYGRFQYEVCEFGFFFDFLSSCGKRVVKGDKYVNFHIPSSGVPLTDEVRLASYKEAYPHYKHLFPDGIAVFGCSSWLLYPRHREFLPKESNILKFLNDFEIVSWEQKNHFGDAWRVFGRYSDLPPAELPRDTKLRKAYADWLTAGNPSGSGFGFFMFDGEKILK